MSNAYDIVTLTIEKAGSLISEWLRGDIAKNPSTIYTVIMDNGSATLTEQSDLPVDKIDHPYKSKTHFYFIILEDKVRYEGYFYFLDPNYHISLIRMFFDIE